MAQEFSLAHLTVLGCAPPEMTYIAARAGYDYVSIRSIFMGLPDEPDYALADNPQLLKQTKRALAETGVRVHDIELARVYEGLHPSKYLPAMEVAAELGAKAVLSSIWGGNREFYVEKFGEICDLARTFGLTVDLEPVPIAVVANLAQAVDVLHAVNRSNAGLMIDMHHFHRAGDNPADLDAVPREWFHFAQLCDAPVEIPTERAEMIRIMRDARLYVGEGGIDVASILAHIPHCVYSIELPNKERHEEIGYAEHATRCLETLKAYLAKPSGAIGAFDNRRSERATAGARRAVAPR
ncbi:MAG: sugar phosphate isomerase/epimerase [Burkholderiales bacterium]|nr:sugar phosphate isomerase/epimerase [Burkholderiales bacterium]